MNRIKPKKIIPYGASLLILLLLTVLKTSWAFACSCTMPGTPSEELKEATAVFSGIVTNIERNSAGYEYKVSFDVEKAWKRISDKTVVVSTGMGGGDCGYDFKKGERYFVYAYGDDPLYVSICSRTALLSAAGEDLSTLDEGKAPPSK